jgi:IS605 OrfB family transposase
VNQAMHDYINLVNSLVDGAVNGLDIRKLTSAKVSANLPSSIKCQGIRDANSVYKKYTKRCHDTDKKRQFYQTKGINAKTKDPKVPELKKPCFFVNNQNFKIKEDCIEFPMMVNGKSKRIAVKTKLTDRQKQRFSDTKFGTMRVIQKNGQILIQVVYEIPEPDLNISGIAMGVDLGIKCPAVSYTGNGNVKFYGNGRKNKYIRRHYAKLRKKLQNAKKMKAVKRINNKEQRIMKDIDHKISREIIETARKQNVAVIRLELLKNIRNKTKQTNKKKTRTSRKNNKTTHSWSFYRLSQYIEYKARLAGIKVEYVNPAYTSKTCPVCGSINEAEDRKYSCDCGYHAHRDVVGAINIKNSTEYTGNRCIA